MRNRWFLLVSAIVLGSVMIILLTAQVGIAQPETAVNTAAASNQPFPIDKDSPDDEEAVTVAYDSSRNRFLVVNENASAMNATCLSASGETIQIYVVPASNGHNPDAVYNPDADEYLVVWEEGGEIWGSRLAAACFTAVPMGTPFNISSDRTTGTEYKPAVAYNNHASHQEYLVVWQDAIAGPNWGIYARRVAGTTSVPETLDISFAVTYTTSAWNMEPDIAYNLNMNEYLVVYTHDPSKTVDPTQKDIYGRRVSNAGGVAPIAENAIDSSPDAQYDPAVAAYRLNYSAPYLVAFTDEWVDSGGDVRAYLVFTTGLPYLLLNISTEVPPFQEAEVAVASNEQLGGYTLVWAQNAGTPGSVWKIFGRRFNGDGTAMGAAPFQVSTSVHNERRPAIAGGSPRVLAAWELNNTSDWDIYARFLPNLTYLPLLMRNH